ncbi:MAG: M67 family metallopeptidase [Planctomycetes bacterium]|nr:M67 family metallopeptidase [Planctomycetota bacterium]
MLTITPEIRAHIEAHAVETYPHECCGVIVGPSTKLGTGRVGTAAYRTGNLNTERAHDRFTLDPKDYMRVDKQARAAGLDIIGIYHSHPDHPAQPSETDRAAAWEGYSYVIVAVNKGAVGDFHSFELHGGQFSQEEVRCL